jgi:hypothetical protein
MAKFSGKIGYVESVETSQSVWEERTSEEIYYGDVLANRRQWETGQGINDDTNINNRISIVADEKALKSFHLMRYVEWMGTKWKISSIEVRPPRLILTLGGVYNDKEQD